MEKEKVVNNTRKKSDPVSSLSSSGLPINWGLLTGPVPASSTHSLGTSYPPPQSSAVHAAQPKVTSFTQRRSSRRIIEKEKQRTDGEGMVTHAAGQITSEVLRQRTLSASSWQSGSEKNLSSSDDEKEVEVRVRLEIHSPPAEVQGEQVCKGALETEAQRSERNEGQASFLTGQPCGVKQGTSVKILPPENSRCTKDDPPHPPSPPSAPSSCSSTNSASSSSTLSASSRHWAPPKGFWRVARPETLVISGVNPHSIPTALPLKDYTQIETLAKPQGTSRPADPGKRSNVVEGKGASSEITHSDSVECHLDRYQQKETDATDPVKGLCKSDSWESISSQSEALFADEIVKVKKNTKLKDKLQNNKEERDQSGHYGEATYKVDCKGAHGVLDDNSDSTIFLKEREPCSRSLISVNDELHLGPRHEKAKRLLERARLKARSGQIRGDQPSRHSHSDQRYTVKKPFEPPNPAPAEKVVQTKDDLTALAVSRPLIHPIHTDTSPSDQGGQAQRYGCSPTQVHFENESEKEAESRYLNRVRQRGRPEIRTSKCKESKTDSGTTCSERSKSHRGVSMPPQRQEDVGGSVETKTVIKEIIVLVKKCEACGSVVREPQSIPLDPQSTEPQQPGTSENQQEKIAPHWVPPNKPEVSPRPKAPLTVTFAGAYVLGENKDSRRGWSRGWTTSGFGKLRRRSRKGESRLESGHGPYGPSWAQRRNSNPRNRLSVTRAVSFAPGSPIALEPHLLEVSGGLRDAPSPSFPIKSALKSSSRNRTCLGQSNSVQLQMTSNQGGEGGSQYLALLDSPQSPLSLPQGNPATISPVPCIRPSTLRYSVARLNPDLPAAEHRDHWDATPDGAAGQSGETGPSPECRASLRSLAISRADDLRQELLRAEHLRAEAIWEDRSRKSGAERDGRPKLFLRRFFSSIGLNSVGRLVKGGRSSSMEQLSTPPAPRASSASPSPTRRLQHPTHIQRTPSLQTLHTVLPLAQLRKASSVQSLERRTERSTILGEVQIPYGLAPSPDSPQLELHKVLSVEDVLASRMVRPVGRVTQAFPDGTLLLELIRPPNGPFGFVISRGKGRPDTGVYVEKVGDGSSEGPYVGLLGVGDEILQVNGETVAGLSLDQVTWLMTQKSTASLRIVPARRSQR